MKWCQAFIKMKEDKAFVRRKVWDKNYFIWYKPAVKIMSSWCKDPNLKAVIDKFGKLNGEGERYVHSEEVFSIYDGFAIKTGFEITKVDRIAEDWEIVEF